MIATIIALIALSICLAISIFIGFNLWSQNRQLEDIVQNNKIEDDAIKLYQIILRLLLNAKSEMDRVDKRGSFSSDDEVGFAFKIMQQSIDTVIENLKKINTNEETGNK